MNIIKIQGGLGNQLFQYAFGKALQNNGKSIFFDLSWYTKNPHLRWERPYNLNKFHTQVNRSPFLSNIKRIKDHGCTIDFDLLKLDNVYFDGYWQYHAFYTDLQPILQKEFTLREEYYTKEFLAYKEMVFGCDSISVHVRRGDYVGKNGFHTLPFSYYYEAISKIKGNHIFIFSDDISWCKKRFQQEYFTQPLTFISSKDYLDFELMKFCKHNVISHSTFSWWAAYLNSNEQKIVVAPAQWTTSKYNLKNYDNTLHYPSSWVKLKTELCTTC